MLITKTITGHWSKSYRNVIKNLKLNKDKCHFRCMKVPFFSKIMLSCGTQPEQLHVLTDVPLYLERNASGVGLGTGLIKAREFVVPMRLSTWQHSALTYNICKQESYKCGNKVSNTEREALGILHGLKKFHYYCFVCEESMIIEHKPLVAILKKDVTILLQRWKQILPCIHK